MTAAVEQTQANATLLAIDEVNRAGGIHGEMLEPVVIDIGASPADFRLAALTLCDQYQVQVLFGTHMSSSRKAVLPVIESRQRLLFYPTLYEGFEYSPCCYYTGAAPNQNSVQLARYTATHFGSRVVFVGVPYVYPFESNRIMRDLFVQAGGEVLEEFYLPFSADKADYAEVMQRIVELAPDAIYSTVVGADIPTLYEAYFDTALDPAQCPIISLSTNEAEVALMRPEVADGHICAAPWFDTLDNPASRHFIELYRHRFGANAPLTAAAEAAYFGVHLYAEGARQANPRDIESIRQALAQVSYDAPQGLVHLNPENHHTWLWPRIARLNGQGRFEIVFEGDRAISPSPYMVEHQLDHEQ
ncbi:ABC-type branched-chain amino acid transport protein [Pseudomonas syringae pv. aceris]|jgi:branched-chain amino acid transport system substrate-binding protein|uniref:ABC-type branched-chain amino acid transport protein n=2 Tax=Pseudomonas syringae TaxID=317 RepID=A0A0L8IQ00_PSESX|nr:ABC-type branched-chain amino acid transport protein [Pseudomonas syringae pv. aceris str. M302273]KOG03520.1 ABC-type branched-chain amino acid transport protein [Pseudomonas syringae pv. aceris]KPW09206.1 ABC-type branched-chain amino acid transport protein [Pseudomonas syringae pv. aceris]